MIGETGKEVVGGGSVGDWDHSSHAQFLSYYAKESQSERTFQRFASVRDMLLAIASHEKLGTGPFEVADIGCGAGAQCLLWAELGHRLHGIDVNQPLVELARQRAAEAGFGMDLQVGSAVQLPWANACMDFCLMPELLEHVADWQSCLNEAARILKPGGVLFVSTTNKVCPKQFEFNLPLYSWYPPPLKRHCEKLALNKRPGLANYAKYPAVNWFSFYSLSNVLTCRGFRSLDRFDVMDLSTKGMLTRLIVRSIRTVPVLRWLGHVATPYTMIIAVKTAGPDLSAHTASP